MKKFLVFTLLLFASVFASHAYAEVLKLKAYSFSARSTDRYGNWSDWSDWSDCNILVVSDDDSRVKIYSEETPIYFEKDIETKYNFFQIFVLSIITVCLIGITLLIVTWKILFI